MHGHYVRTPNQDFLWELLKRNLLRLHSLEHPAGPGTWDDCKDVVAGAAVELCPRMHECPVVGIALGRIPRRKHYYAQGISAAAAICGTSPRRNARIVSTASPKPTPQPITMTTHPGARLAHKASAV